MHNRPGIFISVDGPDGCGKSTQIKVIAEAFKQLGYDVWTTREPGGSPLAEKIRTLLLNEDMDGFTEALLFAAARQDHIKKTIQPGLNMGMVVITDRFHDSSYAYQCAGRGVSETILLENMVVYNQRMDPDFTFFFNVSDETAQKRLNERTGGAGDRFEVEMSDFKKRVKQGYLDRLNEIRTNSYRKAYVVDAEPSIEEVSRNLTEFILNNFPRKHKEQ